MNFHLGSVPLLRQPGYMVRKTEVYVIISKLKVDGGPNGNIFKLIVDGGPNDKKLISW